MKKLLLILLALTMCVSMCACSASDHTAPSQNNTPPKTSNTSLSDEKNESLSCQHKFVEKSGQVVCKLCKEPCVHEYSKVNNKYICDFCETECKHEYQNDGNNMICVHCDKEKVILTAKNIKDYLQFTLKHDYYPKKTTGGYQFCEVDITLTSRPKVDVEFSNLEITYQFVTSSKNWSIYNPEKIEIPFDGEYSGVFNINSLYADYVYASPVFEFVILDVSGEIVD